MANVALLDYGVLLWGRSCAGQTGRNVLNDEFGGSKFMIMIAARKVSLALSWKFALIITIAIAARMSSLIGYQALFVGCAIFGLSGLRQALIALIALLALSVGNPGITATEGGSSSLIWVAILLASLRIWIDVFITSESTTNLLPRFTLPYIAVIFTLSAFASTSSTVSLLKSFSFFFVMSAIVMGMALSERRRVSVAPWILTLWITVLVLSVPTLAVPAIAYLRDGLGFQGVLNHPQGLAVFLAPLIVWMGFKSADTHGREGAWMLLAVITALAMMWLTRGRTGFAAIVLAFVLLLLFRPRFWQQAATVSKRLVSNPLVIGACIAGIVFVLASNVSVMNLLSDLIFKGYESQNISDAYGESRGFIVEQAIANFETRPLTGIGFGVSNSFNFAFKIETDPLTGLPISATTEKANLLLAVIEETGIIGTIVFIPFIVAFVRQIARGRDIAVAAAGMTALCTNVSEMTFFSFGGIGLYTWLIMGWALANRDDAIHPSRDWSMSTAFREPAGR